VINALQSLGLRFDALVLAQHLPYLLTFAKTYPDLPIVIDHCAKPPLRDGMQTAQGDAWHIGMQRLAQETGAFCKVSGLLTELTDAQIPNAEDILSPLIANLYDWFGPDRLMWGSDWPVLTLAETYAGWTDLSTRLLSNCTKAEQAAIYGGTACNFYGLEAA
jgi:L-fuconolactonase